MNSVIKKYLAQKKKTVGDGGWTQIKGPVPNHVIWNETGVRVKRPCNMHPMLHKPKQLGIRVPRTIFTLKKNVASLTYVSSESNTLTTRPHS